MSSTAFVSFSEEEKFEDAFAGCKSAKLFEGFSAGLKKFKGDVILIMSIGDLEALETLKKEPSIKGRMKGLLIKDEIENRNLFSSLMENFKFKNLISKTIDFSSEEELKRIVRAWNFGSQKDLIPSFAAISDQVFYIKTCDFQKIFVPVKHLKSLKGLSKDELLNFKLDEDGSYVHWPDKDIHLDLENFKNAIDPHASLKSKLKNQKFDKTYGKAMRLVREKLGLNQVDLGLSDKQIRRYELGQTRPSYKSYQVIAGAIGIDVKEYMDKLAKVYQKIL